MLVCSARRFDGLVNRLEEAVGEAVEAATISTISTVEENLRGLGASITVKGLDGLMELEPCFCVGVDIRPLAIC